jgi:GNAT superfamily N-acetyltransferase
VATELDTYLRIMLDGQPETAPTVGIRPLTADDRDRLADLFKRLSPTSVYRRFHRSFARLPGAYVDQLLALDGSANVALAATYAGDIVGVARYHQPSPADAAEVAIVVADAWQRHGIGRRLLRALAATASANGVVELCGSVQAGNHAALALAMDVFPAVEANLRFGEHLYDLRVQLA